MPRRRPLLALLAMAPLSAQSPCHDVAGLTAIAQNAVNQLQLPGLVCRLDQHGQTIYSQTFGSYQHGQSMPLASASKAMAATVMLSLIDQGLMGLDDPVGLYLPEFAVGPLAAVTLRMCFAHTSGLLPFDPATTNPAITLRQAAQLIAQQPLVFTPGTEFQYGSVSMHVAGAACEVAGGLPWHQLFAQRVTGPLGMTATDYSAYGPTLNPRIAEGAVSNTDDYMRFLDMLRSGGMYNGVRVLSTAMVDEMMTDQMSHLPVRGVHPHPFGVPCGFGVWIERRDALGRTLLANMPGAYGFFAWVDREHDATCVWLMTTFYVFAFPHVRTCWEYCDATLAPVGVTCLGTASPLCAAPPRINATTWLRSGQPDFGFQVTAGPALAFGGIGLAFGPPGAGVPFLDLIGYMPAQQQFAVMSTDATGAGSLAVPLPGGLQGATFCLQGVWIDTGGCGTSGLIASRALQLDVQAP